MTSASFYIPIPTEPLLFAGFLLRDAGLRQVTHPEEADYLIYPCPTPLEAMCDYCHEAAIIGGNLDFLSENVRRLDLLKDPYYLAENAAITAEAALGMILSHLPCSITEGEILILGWGRIGKGLTHQLAHLNAPLSVFARRQEDRALLSSLGYHPIAPEELERSLDRFRCVVNTAPAVILTEEQGQAFRKDCFKLDLASIRSIPGDGVFHARGLPGKHKPEASGKLIAKTILRQLGGDGL